MFFEHFNSAIYDGREVTNIVNRVALLESIKENTDLFFEYRMEEGDTPETVAYDFYGDSNLHWVILMLNDIVDPFYGWMLDHRTFNKHIKDIYGPPTDSGGGYSGVHHWEYEGVEYQEIKEPSSISINSGGSGYADGDILELKIKTLEPTRIKVNVTGDEVTSFSILKNGIYSFTPSNPVATKTITGYGDGASFDLELSVPSNALAVSNEQVEEAKNIKKRTVKVLHEDYVSDIIAELIHLIKRNG